MKAASVVLLAVLTIGASTPPTKAAYLLHFAQFVEWPVSVLRPGAPLVIGIIGQDPFGRSLDDAIAGRRANGHPLVVRRLRWTDVSSGCHILFVSASELTHLTAILDATRGFSVLTVGDVGVFTERGGMIELSSGGNGVEFDINTEAAAEAHLKISSKLLQIARALRGTVEGR